MLFSIDHSSNPGIISVHEYLTANKSLLCRLQIRCLRSLHPLPWFLRRDELLRSLFTQLSDNFNEFLWWILFKLVEHTHRSVYVHHWVSAIVMWFFKRFIVCNSLNGDLNGVVASFLFHKGVKMAVIVCLRIVLRN